MLKLLLDEPPLIVLPTLAVQIGLNEALVLQQMHYWLVKKRAKRQAENFKKGRYWVYYSYREWREKAFPFWSEVTIQRILTGLERAGLVLAEQLASDPSDRRKWYTIDYDAYQETVAARCEPATPSVCQDAPYQVDGVDDIKLIGSNVSSCKGGEHQVDRVFKGTQNATKIASKTAAECAVAVLPPAIIPPETPAAAFASLLLDLVEAGVNRADAVRLAQANPEECRRQLTFLPFVAEFRTSRGAYLRSAIEGGFGPPPGFEVEQKRRAESERRARTTAAKGRSQQIREQAQEALAATKRQLQADPEHWDRVRKEAETKLPALLKSKPDHVAYGPALEAKINEVIAKMVRTEGGA